MQRFVGQGRLLQKFDTCRTVFLCCDIQDRLRKHIPNFQDAVDVSNAMSKLYQLVGPSRCEFIATEQFPQGLGPISKDIVLPKDTPAPFAKTQPSMLTDEVLPYIIGDKERGLEGVQQAILWGHESHVCIVHTADDLLSRGIRVAVLCDAIGSQRDIDTQASLQTMAAWEGLVLTTSIGATVQLTKNDPSMMKGVMAIMKKDKPKE